jgi:beta-lactamase regulating signal transducer with metallopeptidase domain
MDRSMLMAAGVLSASSRLMVDSAFKGTALLVVAVVAVLILRRDSAATRHLAWLLAMVAMLVVPVLSAMLPQWRVLPEWVGLQPETAVVSTRPPSIARPAEVAVKVAQNAGPAHVESPSAMAHQPAAGPPDSRAAGVGPEAVPAPAAGHGSWLNALPLVWAMGFGVLILRLMAARWMLWNTKRLGTVLGSSRQATTLHDPIVRAFEAACLQLGIGRTVTLLIHPEKTIPVVWGILRCRLLLPAAARNWNGEQLRSVLVHELAHVKRRDTTAQLVAQVGCALYWFNPLVWFAAWRLGVESERACDDLVLASGVRPSAYAGHLLEAVTGLSPARWTQAGL